jgi:3-hydroxyacyl-[acyl-carrier-protein] dehydratase
VIPHWPEEAAALFRRACREPLWPGREAGEVLDRARVEALLPHRPPMLLVHRVISVDLATKRLVATYPLEDGAPVLAGHFPGRPVWPGALQIEAVGQAAILLWFLERGTARADVHLTHVLGARFLRPVPGAGVLTVAVQGVEDGLFTTAVGQCLHDGEICSVAGVSCVVDD